MDTQNLETLLDKLNKQKQETTVLIEFDEAFTIINDWSDMLLAHH